MGVSNIRIGQPTEDDKEFILITTGDGIGATLRFLRPKCQHGTYALDAGCAGMTVSNHVPVSGDLATIINPYVIKPSHITCAELNPEYVLIGKTYHHKPNGSLAMHHNTPPDRSTVSCFMVIPHSAR